LIYLINKQRQILRVAKIFMIPLSCFVSIEGVA